MNDIRRELGYAVSGFRQLSDDVGTRKWLEAFNCGEEPYALAIQHFATSQDIWEFSSSRPGNRVLLQTMENGAAITGFIAFGVETRAPSPHLNEIRGTRATARSRLHIAYLGVHKELQGVGFGTKMLRLAMLVAADQEIDFVDLRVDSENADARALYERHGFKAFNTIGPLLDEGRKLIAMYCLTSRWCQLNGLDDTLRV